MAANKDYHRTMGYADVPLDTPDNFLKTGAGIRPDPIAKDHTCFRRFVPPVPKLDAKRAQSAKLPSTNFKLENIRSVNRMKTRRPSARYVDTRNGDFHDLHSSGLKPQYVYQQKFGCVPKYLIRRNHEITMEEEMIRAEEIKKQPLCRYVTNTERNEILRVKSKYCFISNDCDKF